MFCRLSRAFWSLAAMEFRNVSDVEDDVDSGDEAPVVSSSESGGHHMTTTSLHRFGETDEAADSFTIQIIENMREEYGMFVWPCSIILAEYVWQQRLRFAGISVVEGLLCLDWLLQKWVQGSLLLMTWTDQRC